MDEPTTFHFQALDPLKKTGLHTSFCADQGLVLLFPRLSKPFGVSGPIWPPPPADLSVVP